MCTLQQCPAYTTWRHDPIYTHKACVPSSVRNRTHDLFLNISDAQVPGREQSWQDWGLGCDLPYNQLRLPSRGLFVSDHHPHPQTEQGPATAMFCIPTHHEHNQPRRILHSFRSHRSLRTEATVGSPSTTMRMSQHHRKPSDVSSMTRSSTESARSPTGRSECSAVEWDPLRLHPPMAPGSGPLLPAHQDDSRRYQPHELRQARSMHFHNAQSQANARALHSHSQSAPALVIYGGFDFGFSSDDHKRPSSSSTVSSAGSISEATTPDSCHGAFGWGDPVTRLSPRPHHGDRAGGLGGGPRGLPGSGADHFIKRGEWKRRGIVFASDAPAASEEECFDLEIDS